MELPAFIPIFPLPNVVLFPEVPLPLYIFEPRYCAMVRDTLAGTGLIGMTLLRGDWEPEYYGAPDVFRVGCAGKIVDARPLPDGKFNIVLAGVREFEIQSEQRERAYRQATVVWRPAEAAGVLAPRTRTQLLERVERHMGSVGRRLLRELSSTAELADSTLVNFLAFWLDLSALEKQGLLEAKGADRARLLLEMLEFRRYAADPPPDGGARRVH